MANESFAQGLLQNLLAPQQQRMSSQDIMAAMSSPNPMAAVMAASVPQTTQAIGQGVRGMIGGITGQTPYSATEAYNKAMQQISQQPGFGTTSASLTAMAQAANAVGKIPEAMQLMAQANELKKAEQADIQKKAQARSLRTANIAAVESATAGIDTKQYPGLVAALDGIQSAIFAQTDPMPLNEVQDMIGKAFSRYKLEPPPNRYMSVGGEGVFDTQRREFLTIDQLPGQRGTGGGGAVMMEADSFPSYNGAFDTQTYFDAQEAFVKAETPEQQQAALDMIRTKLDQEGAYYRFIDNRQVIDFTPGSKGYNDREENWKVFDASKRSVVTNADNSLRTIDRIYNGLLDPEMKVEGMTGILAKFIPGTKEYDQAANVETLLSDLGLTELTNMRNSSQNGASGLGQLTENERRALERRIVNLGKAGQSKEQQLDNIRAIRQHISNIRELANTQVSKYSYFYGASDTPEDLKGMMSFGGVEPPPEPGYVIRELQ